MEQENWDYDPNNDDRDFSDLSDDNQSSLDRARSRWGSADVINNDAYNPKKLADVENSSNSSNTDDISKAEKSGTLYATSYCNIHGLWENSQEIIVE